MVTETGLDKINSDPAKKKAFLTDLDRVLKKHDITLDHKYSELVAKPESAKLSPAMSSLIITITA